MPMKPTVDGSVMFVLITLNNAGEERDKPAVFTSLTEERAEGGRPVAGLTT